MDIVQGCPDFLGIRHLDMPLTAEKIWTALNNVHRLPG
jgi:hypothetical protein